MRKVFDWVMDMLYPKTCCFCGEVSTKDVCTACAKKITYITEPRCKKCGKPVRYEEQEYCYDCQKQSFHYEQGRSVWLHKDPVSWSVYQFKYHNRRIYGKFYAQELFRLYGKQIRDWKIELIIPVPLHWRRRRLRGYNQAEVIARHLGRMTGLPVDTRTVVRRKYTNPQKELGNKERKKNLKDVFAVTKEWVEPKRILLVDDIYTTGSTIDEIARILGEKGNHKVWFFTICIGQGF